MKQIIFGLITAGLACLAFWSLAPFLYKNPLENIPVNLSSSTIFSQSVLLYAEPAYEIRLKMHPGEDQPQQFFRWLLKDGANIVRQGVIYFKDTSDGLGQFGVEHMKKYQLEVVNENAVPKINGGHPVINLTAKSGKLGYAIVEFLSGIGLIILGLLIWIAYFIRSAKRGKRHVG